MAVAAGLSSGGIEPGNENVAAAGLDAKESTTGSQNAAGPSVRIVASPIKTCL